MNKILALFSCLMLFLTLASAQPSQNITESDPGLVPGDLFYPLENFAESLEVNLAGLIGGSDFKAKAIANNAEESLNEASILADRNQSEKASEMAEKYYREINNSKKLAENSKDTRLSEKIDNVSSRNVQRLEKVKQKVPKEAREGIENAIQKTGPERGKPEKPSVGTRNSERPQKSDELPGNSRNRTETPNFTGERTGKSNRSNITSEGLNEEDILGLSGDNTGDEGLDVPGDQGIESSEKPGQEEKESTTSVPSGEQDSDSKESPSSSASGDNNSDENPLTGSGQDLRESPPV